jgi:acetoacetyl-CoA synthetase
MSEKDLPLWWEPSKEQVEGSNINKFRKIVNAKYKLNLETYEDLHKFSVDRLTDFWETFWDYAGIRHSRKYDQILTDPNAKPGDLPKFFEGAKLNLAENVLFPLHPKSSTACMPGAPKDWPPSKSVAIYEYAEGSASKQDEAPPLAMEVTWGELRKRVAALSTAFRRKGLKAGDRIANVSANTSDPIVAFLASLAIGAVFSALPTDAGEQAIYGRLSQIQPKLVLTDDFAIYNGKEVNVVDRVARVTDDLLKNGKVEDPKNFEVVCLINKRTKRTTFEWKGKNAKCSSFDDYLKSAGLTSDTDSPLQFEPLPFSCGQFVVFSSGTTGEPKAICHTQGGILMNSKKEALLHSDQGPRDTFLQLTTCGYVF